MKFLINKIDIVDILSKVQGITGRKSNLAITANILIRTMENGILMSATDLETGFEGFYPADIESEGIITINARKLYEIVQNFPSDDILFNEIDNQWIKIGNDSVEYHIVGMDHEDFPDIPVIQEIDFLEMDSLILKRMIEKMVVIGAAGDEKRAHILGVSLEKKDLDGESVIRMASTDGKRLSKVDHVLESGQEFDLSESIIIPKKGLIEVNRLLDGEGLVAIGVKDNHFVVKKDNETIIVSLLEGMFPEYEQVISKDDEFSIDIDKHLFHMMLKRMSILSTEDYRSVIFNFKNNKLVITTTNPTIGESKEEMPIDFGRSEVEIAFNPKYFLETLGSIKEDKIVLNIENEEKPCLVEGAQDKTYLSVIMPMKI